jgi:hypothetical protein
MTKPRNLLSLPSAGTQNIWTFSLLPMALVSIYLLNMLNKTAAVNKKHLNGSTWFCLVTPCLRLPQMSKFCHFNMTETKLASACCRSLQQSPSDDIYLSQQRLFDNMTFPHGFVLQTVLFTVTCNKV